MSGFTLLKTNDDSSNKNDANALSWPMLFLERYLIQLAVLQAIQVTFVLDTQRPLG